MAGKAISSCQHLIKDAQQIDRCFELIRVDSEKTFDRICHAIIIQAL
jgi:hypothetical protein